MGSNDAERAVREVLARVPVISSVEVQATGTEGATGLEVHLAGAGAAWEFLLTTLREAPPSRVRFQLAQLPRVEAGQSTYRVLLAPWFGPDSQAILREAGVGYVDFAGNCRLSFGGIFIEVTGRLPAKKTIRAERSLFAPKSARALRLLLRHPGRAWKVKEIRDAAEISLGQVSHVRQALLSREWARDTSSGLVVSHAGRLLDAWRAAYRPRPARETEYYTVLHGAALDEAVRRVQERNRKSNPGGQGLLLRAHSAARWLAPYLRTASLCVFALEPAEAELVSELGLKRVDRGANVTVTSPWDAGLLHDALEASPGVFTTGIVQTCLDLWCGGERSAEAGDHLRQQRFDAQWSDAT